MRRVAGLEELADRYDSVLCDVWGVLHNGVESFAPAVDALLRFRAAGGRVVLVTNAPRPHGPLRAQLRLLNVPDAAYDDIVTSGDVTRAAISARPDKRVFHLGPQRDMSFYDGLDVHLASEADADLVSCTGLFDDKVETPEHYRALMQRLAARDLVMVCANPDIVVELGDRLIYCAGALARLYQELGGRAILAGKPHKPIYDVAREKIVTLGGSRLLAVGDGLPTDIRGAVANGVDALFVTGGIHAADFGPADDPDGDRVAARLHAEGLKAVAYLPALVWSGSGGRH